MGFDEEENESSNSESGDNGGDKKPTTFFGLELSDGVVYTVVIILTIVFIRQISIVLQALN